MANFPSPVFWFRILQRRRRDGNATGLYSTPRPRNSPLAQDQRTSQRKKGPNIQRATTRQSRGHRSPQSGSVAYHPHETPQFRVGLQTLSIATLMRIVPCQKMRALMHWPNLRMNTICVTMSNHVRKPRVPPGYIATNFGGMPSQSDDPGPIHLTLTLCGCGTTQDLIINNAQLFCLFVCLFDSFLTGFRFYFINFMVVICIPFTS